MAADTSVVAQVELPSLRPQVLKSRLAPTPGLPRYAAQVRNRADQPVTLADPRATRALVALMDVHAVIGGAACHWGGPAAFAEALNQQLEPQLRRFHNVLRFDIQPKPGVATARKLEDLTAQHREVNVMEAW